MHISSQELSIYDSVLASIGNPSDGHPSFLYFDVNLPYRKGFVRRLQLVYSVHIRAVLDHGVLVHLVLDLEFPEL